MRSRASTASLELGELNIAATTATDSSVGCNPRSASYQALAVSVQNSCSNLAKFLGALIIILVIALMWCVYHISRLQHEKKEDSPLANKTGENCFCL